VLSLLAPTLFLAYEPPAIGHPTRVVVPADHTPTPGEPRFFISPPHLAPPAPRRHRRAAASATVTRAGDDVWACVAQQEEGGENSPAGYFGMVSPPSAYPGSSAIVAQYGDSWWWIPYGAQVTIAQTLQASVGWEAWGPRTRANCGLV
jgi:hypothetical protein